MTSSTIPGPGLLATARFIYNHSERPAAETHRYLAETYGRLVRIQLGPFRVHLLSHPDDVEQVLQMNNRNYIKGRLLDKIREVAGNGLFTSEGDFWRRQRRMMQPAFHRQYLTAFAEIMVDETDRMLSAWDVRPGSFDITEDMTHLTLNVVARAMFTTALSEADLATVRRNLGPVLNTVNERSRRPFGLMEKLPTRANAEFEAQLASLEDIILRIIEQRRNNPGEYKDLLQMLIDAQDEDTGDQMTDTQLRDEILTVFVAGHETTAIALSWVWKLLSEHAEVRAALKHEVDTVLCGRTPTAADYPNLPYTRAVFEEAIRLYPPVAIIPRTSLEDDELGGYNIPGGSNIAISTYALHRNEAFWENPDEFDPTRFLPENKEGRHRYAYVPFGGGPRYCIGASFASMEAVIIMAMVTQRYNVDVVTGCPIRLNPFAILRPVPGVEVTLTSRRESA